MVFFFQKKEPCNDALKRDAIMIVIVSLSNFKIRLSMVLAFVCVLSRDDTLLNSLC